MKLTPFDESKLNPEQKFFGVFDLETNRWVNFRLCGFYDGETFHYFLNMKDFCEHLFSYGASFKCYAHFGGGFDFLFVLQDVFADIQKRFEVKNIIPRGDGSHILCFDLLHTDFPNIKITFCDSIAILPFTLKDIGEKFNGENQKQEFDSSNIDKVTPEVIKYCEADCKTLYEGIDSFRNSELVSQTGLKLTTASQSIATLRTFITQDIDALYSPINTKDKNETEILKAESWSFRHDWYIRGKKNAPVVENKNITGFKDIEPAYFGGRTEVFKPEYSGDKPLYYYDFNSMYPAVMRDNEFPHRVMRFFEAGKTKIKFQPEKLGFWDVTVTVPDMFAPPLGIISRETRQPKFIFPVGTFRGKFSTAELAYALELNCKIDKIHSFMHMSSCGAIFKEFVDYVYNMRRNGKSRVEKEIAKLILNSAYGRFGLNPKREKLEIDHFEEGTKPVKIGSQIIELRDCDKNMIDFCVREEVASVFSNVAIAAYVTSHARIKLHKSLHECGEDLYYCDTDSFFTTKKLKTSMNLGDIKIEKSISRAAFILPKVYSVMCSGKTNSQGELETFEKEQIHVKLKGLNSLKVSHLTPDDLMNQFRGSYEMQKAEMRGASKYELEEMETKRKGIETTVYDEKQYKRDMEEYKSNPKEFLKKYGKKPTREGMGIKKLQRSSIARTGKFVERNEVLTRRIRCSYDKRRVFQNSEGSFDTEPWNIKDGKITNS